MTSVAVTTPPRCTPVLLLLFAGSGCAALIYEVVWFHLLRLVVGSSAVSLGFLLLTLSTLRGSADLGLLIGATLLFAILADLFLAPILVARLRPRLDPWYRK